MGVPNLLLYLYIKKTGQDRGLVIMLTEVLPDDDDDDDDSNNNNNNIIIENSSAVLNIVFTYWGTWYLHDNQRITKRLHGHSVP